LFSLGIATKVIAASLALSAFAIAIVAGLAAGNPARTVLVHALVSMIVCQMVGLIAGALAERAVLQHLAAYRAVRPVPGVGGQTVAPTQGALPGKKSDLG
jgi:hypothetical protein